MSSKLPTLPPGADMGKTVAIRQLLKQRDAKIEELNTKTYMDTPVSVAVHPTSGETIVVMESGKVWKTDGSSWKPVCWWPLPDSTAAEDYDEFRQMNTELSNLGHVEED